MKLDSSEDILNIVFDFMKSFAAFVLRPTLTCMILNNYHKITLLLAFVLPPTWTCMILNNYHKITLLLAFPKCGLSFCVLNITGDIKNVEL